MNYKNFENPQINPRNASEILSAAVSTVYRLSAGDLRNFIPGSPVLVLLESLIFAHVEFLYWCENLPDAILYTLFSKALGVGISPGSKSTGQITVTLTTTLQTQFIIPAGAVLLSGNNEFQTTNNLTIAAGSNSGTVAIESLELGSISAGAGTINQFQANFSFVATVSNLTAVTLGSVADSPTEAQAKIQALLTQRNPSSEEDWVNIGQQFFGENAVIKIGKDTPNITVYVKGLQSGDPAIALFNTEALRQRNLLQDVFVLPYNRIGTELQIKYSRDTPNEDECKRIATELNSFITDFNGNPQLVDVYEKFTEITGETDLVDFNLFAYDFGVLLTAKVLKPYTFEVGEILKNNTANYFISSSNEQIIGSAFDEAELGFLNYFPIIENFAGGFIEADYIVKFLGNYYLTTVTGQFQTVNSTLLTNPLVWDFAQNYTQADFIREASPINELSHGFVPISPYTSASNGLTSLSPITPVSKLINGNVSSGEIWFLNSQPAVLYTASSPAIVTAAYLQTLQPSFISDYPRKKLINHWLTNSGKFRIGLADPAKDFIYVDTEGNKKAIPPSINTQLLQSAMPEYGTLFLEQGSVYEFVRPSFALTFLDLLNARDVRRATTQQDDFTFITYPGETPYFLEFATISFLRGFANDPEKTFTLNATGEYERT